MVGRAILLTAVVVALVWALDTLLPLAVAAIASVVVIVAAFVVYARMEGTAGRAGRARSDRGQVRRAGLAALPDRTSGVAELPSGRHLDYRPTAGRGGARSRRVVADARVTQDNGAAAMQSDDVVKR